MKKSKLLAGLAAVLTGVMLGSGCTSGFTTGLFRRGFIDNKFWDVVTDWLNEDLFG